MGRVVVVALEHGDHAAVQLAVVHVSMKLAGFLSKLTNTAARRQRTRALLGSSFGRLSQPRIHDMELRPGGADPTSRSRVQYARHGAGPCVGTRR